MVDSKPEDAKGGETSPYAPDKLRVKDGSYSRYTGGDLENGADRTAETRTLGND